MPYLTRPVLAAGTLCRTVQPTLATGDGLSLRPWREEDAPAVFDAFQDPVMRQWHLRAADSVDEVRGWIAEWQRGWAGERNAQWAVVDAAGGRLLGRVALREIVLADGVAEVAYWTVAAARRQRVAARAATALARWALDEVGFHRLELSHAVANVASCRVAERAGFAAEGIKRGALLHADGWHDMHLHARLRGDGDRARPGGQ
ncbi:GNAT family N-acetyltransferase [Streptomyces griseoviridis]|uniref:RimJ/RimL family protein N-acetyltransferase n=1 Tax=Streptomyces griseoviridis TaxID=45398 RepID=A0ABT9LAS3_STRGD|nr:GNAT family N-acetyltransferase [Streptomyces griseoviridis]MDP9680823.1 RimJ/RimL family protein N-acetyltransferase [Streptomyces griseoviridis]GGS97347.1 acetyltransferase [Streptomyces griseoviridis]